MEDEGTPPNSPTNSEPDNRVSEYPKASLVEDGSIPLQSVCANCGQGLAADTCVAFYTMPTTRMSVSQGLELIFKWREGSVEETMPSLLKLCASCGHSFGKTLKWYHKFIAATSAESFVKNLTCGDHSIDASSLVKVEASDGEMDDPVDCIGENALWVNQRIPTCKAEDANGAAASLILESNSFPSADSAVSGEADTKVKTRKAVNLEQRRKSSRDKKIKRTNAPDAQISTNQLRYKSKTRRHERILRLKRNVDTEDAPSELSVSEDESAVHVEDDENEKCGGRRTRSNSRGKIYTSTYTEKRSDGHKNSLRKGEYKNKDRRSYAPTAEEESLLATTEFKCDSKDCSGVSFPTFREWVSHQHSSHSLDTGYDLQTKEPLIPAPGKPRPCPRCGRKAPSHPKMLLHIRTVHLRLKQFSCDACPRHFASRLGLKWHNKSAHSGLPNKFKCPTCSTSFPSRGYLEEHEVHAHAALRPFLCDEEGCRKNFRTNDALRSHVKRTHPHRHVQKVANRRKARDMTDEEKALLVTTEYKCDSTSCPGVSFPSFKDWVRHQEEVHSLGTGYNLDSTDVFTPIPGKVRPCPLCGKKFKSRFVLLTHVQSVHLRTGRVPCETCGRDFVNELSLKQHRAVTHDGTAQKFLCSLCGASFNSKSYLQEHEEIHYGRLRRSKDCDICGAKFRRRYNLDLHKAEAHAQGDPSICDICGKVFKVKQRMEIHKRRQHVKKSIIDQICELCGKGYAFKHYLKDHLMSVHKLSDAEARELAKVKLPPAIRKYTVAVKPKTCEYCLRKYVRREQLFTHLMSVHGKTKEEAIGITGLETKRELIPGSSTRGKRPKRSTQPTPPVDPVPYQHPPQTDNCHTRVPPFESRSRIGGPDVPYDHQPHHHLPFYLG